MSDLGRIEITEELCNMIMIGRLIQVLEVILASVANDIKKQLLKGSDINLALRLWAIFVSSGPTNQMLYEIHVVQ